MDPREKREVYPTLIVINTIILFKMYRLYQFFKKKNLHSEKILCKVNLSAKCNGKTVPNGAIGTTCIKTFYSTYLNT